MSNLDDVDCPKCNGSGEFKPYPGLPDGGGMDCRGCGGTGKVPGTPYDDEIAEASLLQATRSHLRNLQRNREGYLRALTDFDAPDPAENA